MSDPKMPKIMPAEVERELQKVLGFLYRPSPVEVYDAIRGALPERRS